MTYIWGWLTDSGLTTLIDTLTSDARDAEGGNDREVVVVAAMHLCFLYCQYVPVVKGLLNQDPLGIAIDGIAAVIVHYLPGEVRTIGDAVDHLRTRFFLSPQATDSTKCCDGCIKGQQDS